MTEAPGTRPLPELPHLPEETPIDPHETQFGRCDGGIPTNIQITRDGAIGTCPGVCGRQTTWIVGFHQPDGGYRQGYWMLRSQITGG